MDTVIRVSALCMTAAVLAALIKKNNPEMALLLTAAVCVVVLAALRSTLHDIHGFLQYLTEGSGISAELFQPLLKTLGIALVGRVGADLCKDAGQNAMAGLVEMAASFGAILVTVPLFSAVWEMLQTML